MKRKVNDMGLNVINDAAGLSFSELNSEAFKNMMNSAVNDGINLDENETPNRNIMSKKVPGIETSISHVDLQSIRLLKQSSIESLSSRGWMKVRVFCLMHLLKSLEKMLSLLKLTITEDDCLFLTNKI